MSRLIKWLAFALAAISLLLAGVALALQQWLRTDDFRERVQREASAALGVPVQLGRLSVDLWPLPAVGIDQVRLQTRPVLTIDRVEARPRWAGLLAGRLELATLVVRKVVLPQAALGALGAALQKKEPPRAGAATVPGPAPAQPSALVLPRKVVLEDITWIDARGQRMTADARADFGDDALLDAASFRIVQGRFAGAHGQVKRENGEWPMRLDIGGGHVSGKLQLTARPGGGQLLQGQLATEGVEIAALMAPSRTLTGRLQAQTSLRAEYREPGQLLDVLQTQTRFTVRGAVLQGIDLEKAVKTVGLSRGGSTRLDALAGQVSTQGKAIQLTHLVANSGLLGANGNVSVSPANALSGRINVALGRVAVGVPLVVGGTLDDPSVSLTRGGWAGAAFGLFGK